MKKIYSFLLLGMAMGMPSGSMAQELSGVSIYINPGHGGFDSDDRNVAIYPFDKGDPKGFWESQSNLDKGFHLRDLLQERGAKVFMSRTQNRTEDDLSLSKIVAMANASDADFMLSIHSNAGVTSNMVLQLYAGKDPDDAHIYPTPTPYSEEGRAICTVMAQYLYSNEANVWGNRYSVRGDKTFGRTAMDNWSDGYGVLRGLTIPGCISEGSMHDYIPETYRLMNSDYKWLEAWHFLKTFSTYFAGKEIPTGNIVGKIHDSHNKNEASYAKIPNSHDIMLPLNKVKVTLNPGNKTYETDNMDNGIYVFKDLLPGTYSVKFEADVYYSKEFTVEVKQNMTSYQNVALDKIRITPPEVISHSPNVAEDQIVLCSTPIVFDFNWDIDEESAMNAFSIIPEVTGDFTFEDSSHRMIFTPRVPYNTSTRYTVTLDKSLKHPGNICMENDFVFSFFTADRNRLALIKGYPSVEHTQVNYEKPVFFFVFDRPLDVTGIKDAINVYNSKGEKLEKNSRSQSNNKVPAPWGSASFQLSANLIPGETYTVRIDGSLKDKDQLAVVESIEYPFVAVEIQEQAEKPSLDFETNQLISFDPALSTGVLSASVGLSSSKKLFGNYSNEFKYEFSKDGNSYYKLNEPLWLSEGNCLGFYLLGDLTENEIGFEVKGVAQDKSETAELVSVGNLNFFGWEYKEKEFNMQPSRRYKLTGFYVRQAEGELNAKGNFFMDNLHNYNELLNSVSTIKSADIQVYPNPAHEWIYINIPDGNSGCMLQLYTLDGHLIKSSEGVRINVSEVLNGMYILKIKTKTTLTSQVVQIRHY